MSFKVLVGVCAYREIKAKALPTLFALRDCPDPKITVKVQEGDALISRSRSLVAKYFLEKTKDDLLMFLDDDVIISPFDATQLMHESMKLDLDVVGAAYCTKSKDNPAFAVKPLGKQDMRFGNGGMLYEMRNISTGCMVIKRRVFEKMIELKKIPYTRNGKIEYYPFFQHRPMLIDGNMEDISEDWFFCEKAIECGFRVWCDSTIKLGHVGNYEYDWDDIVHRGHNKVQKFDAVDFKLGFCPPQEDGRAVESRKAEMAVKGETHG